MKPSEILTSLSVRIPREYGRDFLQTVTSEDLWRLAVGMSVITVIEIGILLTGHFVEPSTLYLPPAAIVFNCVMIPLALFMRRKEGMTGRKRMMVYATVLFYVVWAIAYTWIGRSARPMSEPGISLYVLVVYGSAVFVYMEPRYSAAIFFSGLALLTALISRASFGGYFVTGYIWNAIALTVTAWITSRLLYGFRMNTYVSQMELEKARAASDRLLLNILPEKIVKELKSSGSSPPERFNRVTVLFSDLVDFTVHSRRMTPETLIAELNALFAAFDHIAGTHECVRIKTIGDAYMCVCGLPEENSRHAEMILGASLEMMRFLEKRNSDSDHVWKMRIGVHTGSVIGGIVGTTKYIYDLFGDTINIAQRMENHSGPMRINVSEDVYIAVGDGFVFEERGPVNVKGIGTRKMYYLKGVRENGHHETPSTASSIHGEAEQV